MAIAALIPLIGTVLNKFLPDPEQRAKAEAELTSALQGWDSSQSEINKTEAQSMNLFVAGWRPAIGWTCALALIYQYLLVPLAVWGSTWSGHDLPTPPRLDDVLWELLFGMLGMGGLRTFEKLKGVAR